MESLLTRRATAIAAAVAWYGLGLPARPVAADSTQEARTEAVVEAAARAGFSGAVFVEQHGSTLVDAAVGWADESRKKHVDHHTLYDVASVTKLVTAIAVLRLVEQGKVTLADDLRAYLPEAPPDKAKITIEQLLLHRSGLGQNHAADGIASRDEAVRTILATKLLFPPGTAQQYSNDGVNLVAAVLEKATGRGFREVVRGEILAPAGLERTLLWEEVDEPRHDSGDGDWTNIGWFTRVEPRHPRLLWIRGTEQNGYNAALYGYPDDGLITAITTNVGPFESGRVTVSRALAARLEEALLPGAGTE